MPEWKKGRLSGRPLIAAALGRCLGHPLVVLSALLDHFRTASSTSHAAIGTGCRFARRCIVVFNIPATIHGATLDASDIRLATYASASCEGFWRLPFLRTAVKASARRSTGRVATHHTILVRDADRGGRPTFPLVPLTGHLRRGLLRTVVFTVASPNVLTRIRALSATGTLVRRRTDFRVLLGLNRMFVRLDILLTSLLTVSFSGLARPLLDRKWIGTRILSLRLSSLRIDNEEVVGKIGGVFFFLSEDVLDHSPCRRVVLSEIPNHLLVDLDHRPFGYEVLPDHVGKGFALDILRCRTLKQRGGIEVRLAAQLLDAFTDHVGMLTLFVGMFLEFIGNGASVHARRHEEMVHVTEHAHDLRGECLVEYFNRLVLVTLVGRGDRTVFNLLHCTLTDFFDVFNKAGHETSQGKRLSAKDCHREISCAAAVRSCQHMDQSWRERDVFCTTCASPGFGILSNERSNCNQFGQSRVGRPGASGAPSMTVKTSKRAGVELARPGNGSGANAPVLDSRFDRRLAEILDAAAAIFYEKGYEGASMRDLSRESGMSLSGLYHYFDSKEKLLYLIQRHTFLTIVDRLREQLAGNTDPEEGVRIFIRNHLEYFIANMKAMKVLSHEADLLKGHYGQEIQTIKREYYRICVDLLEAVRIARLGKNTPPPGRHQHRTEVLALFGMLNWIYTWYNPQIDPPASELAEDLAELYLRGVLAEPLPRKLRKGRAVAVTES